MSTNPLYLKLWTLHSFSQTVKNVHYLPDTPWGSAEKAMAPHSSTLAWKIPWTEEPGGLQSMGSLKVRHDWATSLSLFTFMHWRRKWQPTPVFLPGESQERGACWAAVYGVAQSQTRLKRQQQQQQHEGLRAQKAWTVGQFGWNNAKLCKSGVSDLKHTQGKNWGPENLGLANPRIRLTACRWEFLGVDLGSDWGKVPGGESHWEARPRMQREARQRGQVFRAGGRGPQQMLVGVGVGHAGRAGLWMGSNLKVFVLSCEIDYDVEQEWEVIW